MRQSLRQAKAQAAAKTEQNKKKRGYPMLRGMAALLFVGLLGVAAYQFVMHPQTPLPRAWNPVVPLALADPVTPLTAWKLDKSLRTEKSCIAVLSGGAQYQRMPDLETSGVCHIKTRVRLAQVGDAAVTGVETTCGTALRLAMWEKHSLQPAARGILGSDLTKIDHLGSYSCRAMRTSAGTSARMSTHATANAIDVSGFRFSDGQRISLLRDWDDPGQAAEFLRAARDGACKWFGLTLSPDYNTLHADHFHLQAPGWGGCR